MNILQNIEYGFPWWLRWQSICLQCGRHGFYSWVGNIPWRRKWQSTPALLPGNSHGWRSLIGYSPWGRKELDMTEWLHFSLSPFSISNIFCISVLFSFVILLEVFFCFYFTSCDFFFASLNLTSCNYLRIYIYVWRCLNHIERVLKFLWKKGHIKTFLYM